MIFPLNSRQFHTNNPSNNPSNKAYLLIIAYEFIYLLHGITDWLAAVWAGVGRAGLGCGCQGCSGLLSCGWQGWVAAWLSSVADVLLAWLDGLLAWLYYMFVFILKSENNIK